MWVGFISHCGLGLAPHLGFGSVLLFVYLFILGSRTLSIGEAFLMVMAEVQEGAQLHKDISNLCNISANIPLAKAI